jgi:hypothetical protein
MKSAGPRGTMPAKPARRTRGRPPADAPARPDSARAAGIKNSRYALWKNPENLTEKQQTKLAWIVQTDPRLARAYYLKEGLRVIFKLPLAEATEALDKWVGWARRCRIPSFVKLQKSIVKHRTAILASIEHGLSNGRVESQATSFTSGLNVQPSIPAVLVTSDDDPYCSPEQSTVFADAWRIPLLSVEQRVHLNSASGLGSWIEGRNLLTAFMAGLAAGPERLAPRPTNDVG